MFDVCVVGGGPVGSRSAALLAKTGFKVCIIEEHSNSGVPVQCAGLVTPRVASMVNVEGCVLNKVRGAEIISPKGQIISFKSKEDKALVLDRQAFDSNLLRVAVDAGAELMLGHRVDDVKLKQGMAQVRYRADGGKDSVVTRLVIGADGASSVVARSLGFPQVKKYLSGYQEEHFDTDMERDIVRIHVGNKLAPSFFAWEIPGRDTVRVGLACEGGSAMEHFHKLQASGIFKARAAPVHTLAGTIPLGTRIRTYDDNALLVGDAAGQVKATTGGGIYMGLKAAEAAVKAVQYCLERDSLSRSSLERYQRYWYNSIGKELKNTYKLHRVLCSLSDAELEDIFKQLNKPGVLEVIQERGDIDYPSRLVFPLVRKAPMLVKYAPRMWG